MKLRVSPSPVQSDTGQQLHPSRAGAVRIGRRQQTRLRCLPNFLNWSHPALSAVLSALQSFLGGVGRRAVVAVAAAELFKVAGGASAMVFKAFSQDGFSSVLQSRSSTRTG